MFRIVRARRLAPDVRRFAVEAPRVARKQRPGQFVIVRVHERGERIPLTIAGGDPVRGTIDLIVQGVGKTTRLMNRLEAGYGLLDVAGPLGEPTPVQRWGTVAVVAGGVGAAIAYPTARAFAAAGNRVLFLLGARSRRQLILEDEIRSACHRVLVSTDDGSAGSRGTVVDRLEELLASGRRIDHVFAVGPVPMMRAAAEATRPRGIPTAASLNSIMVDGTGMCGGCRVLVGGESRFACVDGPEFDAHRVDFDSLARRNAQYREAERRALERFEARPEADLARARRVCGRERSAAAAAEACPAEALTEVA